MMHTHARKQRHDGTPALACGHVEGPRLPPRRRPRRDRLLGWPRHLGRGRLDARARRRPLRVHRRPRPVRRGRHRLHPRPRAGVRRRAGAARRLQGGARPRGPRRAAVRRVPHLVRPGAPTSTRRRSAAPSPARCWCRRCARTASRSGATARPTRATTSSGSTATGCSPTRCCASTSRGSTPTSSRSSAAATRCREWLRARDLPYRASTEKAYSTDANIWGATHEAKKLEHLDESMDLVEPIMGVRFWDDAVAIASEEVIGRVRRGLAGRDQRPAVRRPRRARARGERDRRPARPRHVRPDREPHHRGEEPRHLRGAGHGAAVDRLRAARERDPQRGHARVVPRGGPPARPPAVRGPLVRPAGADAARVAAALGRPRGHRRGARCGCAAARTTPSSRRPVRTSRTTPSGCRWSGRRAPRSARSTASAS